MIDLNKYNYHLPSELLANIPASPRDSARLFVYDIASDTIRFDFFRNLDKYLPSKSLLVFNDTKVVPARAILHKEVEFYPTTPKGFRRGKGGGRVEVLLLVNEYRPGDKSIKGMVDRKVELGQKLFFDEMHWLVAKEQEANIFHFVPNFAWSKLETLLSKYGQTPIPHYLKQASLKERELRNRYQSIFAKNAGSVAAPTASLHFTSRVINKLKEKGITNTHVTLNVGMGTFAPIDEANFQSGKLHREWCEVSEESAAAVNKVRANGYAVVSVGTTATRTLESAAATSGEKILQPVAGMTDIFIYPPYHFRVVDAMITNFHLPRSSLMLLVDAFLKDKGAKRNLLDLYRVAVEEQFRFYSFGDAMLIK